MNILQQTIKFYHQNHSTTFSNSTVPTKNKNWLPGGTTNSDLGRWRGAKMHRKHKKIIQKVTTKKTGIKLQQELENGPQTFN